MDPNIVEMLTDGTFVDQHYQMDPTEDDLIRSYRLRDGMRVLIESPTIKSALNVNEVGEDIDEFMKALTYNRWMVVTELGWNRKENLISFIARYDDGSKRTINVGMSHSWYVKLDSVPQEAPSLLQMLGMFVVPAGDPEEMANSLIEQMKRAGVPFDDSTEEQANKDGRKMGGDGSEWVKNQEQKSWTDPNNEIAGFDAGVASKDPSWVQELETKWQDEKGTSTGGGLIENLNKL